MKINVEIHIDDRRITLPLTMDELRQLAFDAKSGRVGMMLRTAVNAFKQDPGDDV